MHAHCGALRERVLRRDEILDAVWGTRFVTESALTSRIKAARRAIGDDGSTRPLELAGACELVDHRALPDRADDDHCRLILRRGVQECGCRPGHTAEIGRQASDRPEHPAIFAGIDTERGWGRLGETWTVRDELAAYGAEPSWFGLGDRDLATHLVRRQMLDAGYPLSQVTQALLKMAASDPEPAYADLNPVALPEPLAPELAARDADIQVDLAPMLAAHARLKAQADAVVVEGVGGWMAPLAPGLMQADLARALDLPVVLVVGMRLGCINHARLTVRALAEDGVRLAGWIANEVEPAMPRLDDNVAILRMRLPAPYWGRLPHAPTPDPVRLARHLQLPAA